MAESRKVAVIGAGVSGLVTARELQREGHRVVVFEKSNQLGGLWVYNPRVETDLLSLDPNREIIHSSLYKSLRTNLPRQLMSFSDYSFECAENGNRLNFPGHEEVLKFLNEFAEDFGISKLIRFNTEVVRVEQVEFGGNRWVVESKSNELISEEVFDSVVICNGHYTIPRIANIPGINNWPGKQIHSHNYRVPEPFKDQIVVVIGDGPSGLDICRDIATVAKEVHLSTRSSEIEVSKLDNYANLWNHSKIDHVDQSGEVTFLDGSSIHADIILHCTGYKFTLFNELYFLVAGGTVWIDSGVPSSDSVSTRTARPSNKAKVTKVKSNKNGVQLEQTAYNGYGEDNQLSSSDKFSGSSTDSDDVGRFLYLEGVEYVMWCTYDVHFYASFALLALFPKIELSIQREFAKAVLCEDGRKVRFLAEGNWGIRKMRGAIPHDLGMHDPWHEMNAYNIHDTSKWKDLNPKFVLQVYRDFAATGDFSFATDVWPSVCAAIEYMEQFDGDNDCLIENDGFPDQTYDTWTVHGISAYCGGLWLAALQAAAAMAMHVGDYAFAEKCKSKLIKAKTVYEEKLWNGSYFNYDSGSSSNSKSIQADQLAGQWYMSSSGLPDLFDSVKIKSTLQKIYDFNVMKVRGGRMGAVNGMHPNGKVDDTCMQSREIWTGVTYGVAAMMLHAGMEEQAFTTAEGIFIAGWSEDGYGYSFQTPEGWTTDGHFRSLIYMRPLSIWGMQWALSMPKTILDAPKVNIMDRIQVNPHTSHETGPVRKIVEKAKCFNSSIFSCSC